jgi:very-short-patch-repair endonuclease
MITSRLRRGELMRLRSGVYLAHGSWPEDSAEQAIVRARAEIAAHPEAVMSHASAAIVWNLPHPGFDSWSSAPPCVTFPPGGPERSTQGAATHHVRLLPADHVTKDTAGWPVTNVSRTAIDLADGLNLPEALVILDAAARRLCAGYVGEARRRDFSNPRLVEAAHRDLTIAARACRKPRLTAAIDLVDPGRESAAESLSAGHFHCAGLPAPRFQAALRTPFGTFYPDCLWSERKLIGECDGAVKYADSRGYVQEKAREQILRDLGFEFVRWQAKEIMLTPEAVVARVARALGL